MTETDETTGEGSISFAPTRHPLLCADILSQSLSPADEETTETTEGTTGETTLDDLTETTETLDDETRLLEGSDPDRPSDAVTTTEMTGGGRGRPSEMSEGRGRPLPTLGRPSLSLPRATTTLEDGKSGKIRWGGEAKNGGWSVCMNMTWMSTLLERTEACLR